MTSRRRWWLILTGMTGLLFLAGNFAGCEPEDWILAVDCGECFDHKPDSAALIVYLSINEENPAVPLTIFRGNADGEVDWRDTATSEEFYLEAAIWKEYTVRAEYLSGSKPVVAYDSDKMTLKDYGEDCGDPCYVIKGGIFNLQLREIP